MLSNQAIEKRLKTGAISLQYYFLPQADGTVGFHKAGVPVDVKQSTNGAWDFFRQQLKTDRLGLTLGPIIKSHTHNLITGRPTFRGRRGYSDLRDTGGKLVIGPRESVSVATNERIALDGSTAALILPRITLGDAGLVLNSAYVDPFWDGTLQLVLTNVTPHAQSIALLEPIAQCFFFNVAPAASDAFAPTLPGKSHHFGQNWHKILEEDAEPFPTRKRPLPTIPGFTGFLARIRNLWNAHQAWLKAAGGLLLVIVGVTSWNSISGPLGRLPELERKVAKIEPYFDTTSALNVPALQTAVRDLEASTLIRGTETLTIPAGALSSSREVTVKGKLNGSGVVITGTRETEVDTWGVVTAARDGGITLQLRVEAESVQNRPVDYVINWALIP